MNGSTSPPRASSQARAGSALSGAGPYSSVSKISAMVAIGVPSGQRVAVGGRVAAGGVVLELALEVSQEARGADAEKLGTRPGVAQLLLHQGQPVGSEAGRS